MEIITEFSGKPGVMNEENQQRLVQQQCEPKYQPVLSFSYAPINGLPQDGGSGNPGEI